MQVTTGGGNSSTPGEGGRDIQYLTEFVNTAERFLYWL